MTKMQFTVLLHPDIEEDGYMHIQEHLGDLVEHALLLSGFGVLESAGIDDSVELSLEDIDANEWPTCLQLASKVIQTVTTRDLEAENYSHVMNEVVNLLLELPVAKTNVLRMVDSE